MAQPFFGTSSIRRRRILVQPSSGLVPKDSLKCHGMNGNKWIISWDQTVSAVEDFCGQAIRVCVLAYSYKVVCRQRYAISRWVESLGL